MSFFFKHYRARGYSIRMSMRLAFNRMKESAR